jgi:hypothetical protein
MAKLGPRVTGENQVTCPILDGTGIEIHCRRDGDQIWIQLRQPGRADQAEWRVVQTSFSTRDGDINFKRNLAD